PRRARAAGPRGLPAGAALERRRGLPAVGALRGPAAVLDDPVVRGVARVQAPPLRVRGRRRAAGLRAARVAVRRRLAVLGRAGRAPRGAAHRMGAARGGGRLPGAAARAGPRGDVADGAGGPARRSAGGSRGGRLMARDYTRSREAMQRAARLLPGGADSTGRAYRAVGGEPLCIDRASGCTVVDLDGNEYVDYVCSYGPLILGHAHPRVVEAVR